MTKTTPTISPDANAGGMRFMLRALRHRNYRLFFFGQGVSLVGSWLTITATSWLVYRLAEGDPLLKAATVLGVVRFAGQIPAFLVAPLAGILVDRWDKHRLIVLMQALSLLQSAALAFLSLAEWITIPQVIVLNIFQGFINAFDAPARQAFVVEMIEHRDDLPNAIALNSSVFNASRLIGPAVAGLLIAETSEGICFLIDAISYAGVLVALLMMRVHRIGKFAARKHPLRELHEGFNYAFGFRPVRSILLLGALMSIVVSIFQTLMPMFAATLAPQWPGARVFGFLGGAIGLGAFAGSIYLAMRRSVIGLARVLGLAGVVLGTSMAWFAETNLFWLAMLLAVINGLGTIISFAAGNTLLQSMVDDRMRGRLMAFFIMAVMGTAPLGSAIAGWLATPDRLGASHTVALAGLAAVVGSVIFLIQLPAMRRLTHPIYIEKGILPTVTPGLQQLNEAAGSPER